MIHGSHYFLQSLQSNKQHPLDLSDVVLSSTCSLILFCPSSMNNRFVPTPTSIVPASGHESVPVGSTCTENSEAIVYRHWFYEVNDIYLSTKGHPETTTNIKLG
jgi:hypothetical protein